MIGNLIISVITLGAIFNCKINAQAPLAEGQPKFLGCAWSVPQATDFAKYWNQVTPENGGKWGSVESVRDVMVWTEMDAAFNIAGSNDFLFKNHTLIWGNQQPAWIENLDSAEQMQEIIEWFASVATRYDDIDFIDVVNEPLHAPPTGAGHGNYINALGGTGDTGWDWVINSFKLARQHFPHSQLLINEYNIVNSLSNTLKYIEIINLLKAENLIDGIGIQAHAFSTYGISSELIKSNLDLLGATDLPVYVSEMDVDGSSDLIQLSEYQRLFPLFWNHPDVAGITLWGFQYGLWRTSQGAYLVNANGTHRPAFQWLKAFVNDTLTIAQSLDVVSNKDTIFIDETIPMATQFVPFNTTIKNVTWSATPSTVGTISASGVLTPVATGVVTVKATTWDQPGIVATKVMVIGKRHVEIYPNPVENGRFVISGIANIHDIMITDVQGKLVKSFRNLKQPTLDVWLNAAAGMYIITFSNKTQSTKIKVILN